MKKPTFPREIFKSDRGKGVILVAKGDKKIGRNADDGKFTTVKKAQQDPKHHVVETIKKKK